MLCTLFCWILYTLITYIHNLLQVSNYRCIQKKKILDNALLEHSFFVPYISFFFFAFDTFVLSLKSIICKEAVNNVKEANINDGKCVQILLKPVYENKGLSLNHTE